MSWKAYHRKGSVELRPYIPGESLAGVSVSPQDTPCLGDMIARNPQNHADQWLIAKAYFEAHYEEVAADGEARG